MTSSRHKIIPSTRTVDPLLLRVELLTVKLRMLLEVLRMKLLVIRAVERRGLASYELLTHRLVWLWLVTYSGSRGWRTGNDSHLTRG